MSKNVYSGKKLPELYLIASEREIKSFFPKDETEMIALLTKWDEAHNESNVKEEVAGDSEVDLAEIDDILPETNATEQVNNRLGLQSKKQTNRKDVTEIDKPEEVVDEVSVADTDDIIDDINEPVEEEEKPVEVEKPATKPEKGKKMAKPVANAETMDDILNDVDAAETTKPAAKAKAAPAAKAKAAPAKAEKPAKEAPASKGNDADGVKKAPYREGTAGYICYLALKKGGTIEAVVALADAAIAKNKIKPPKDTKAKCQIIMREINRGVQGKGWGTFATNDKGKITFTA